MNGFDRIDWICQKCGQANYQFYLDEVNMVKMHKIEDKGMDSANTCINCEYQRDPKTRVNG